MYSLEGAHSILFPTQYLNMYLFIILNLFLNLFIIFVINNFEAENQYKGD